MKKIGVLVFCLIIFSILVVYVLASDFNCTIVTNTSCTGGNNISVLYMENDSGGYYNAHAQNISVAVSERYNYALCCDVTGDTITTSCQDSIFLRLYNETNSHIQQPLINTYTVPACMSATTGTISCNYGTSCSAGKACIASMASSNASTNNQTNAHIGPCNEYATKICCGLNTLPEITIPILNSTYRTNKTTENLTVYTTISDTDNDNVRLIYNWYRNNKSLSVLNMPFDNGNSTWTKDYSAYGNNGSVNGTTFNSTGGWNSTGAYEFDGINDYISTSGVSITQTSGMTIAGWIKPAQAGVWRILTSGNNYFGITNGNSLITQYQNATSGSISCYGSSSVTSTTWRYLVVTLSNTTIKMYLDGVEETLGTCTQPSNTGGIRNDMTWGGYIGQYSGTYTNGTIDEVMIFNRSLSAEQIKALFNNRTDRIVSQETTKGEIWRVDVTPHDGTQDGSMKSSNNLTILNSVPTVSLSLPLDNNLTTNRTPMFSWTGSDDDNDAITYTLNLTCYSTSGGTCSDDNRYVDPISPTSYTLTSDLKYLQDNGYYYNWTVRAYDGTSYSSWATQRRIDIKALIDIFLVNDTVEFGNMGKGESKNTTTDNPPPLVIRNNGNSFINISANATSLWNTEPSPTTKYRFKIDNKTSEPGSFNWLLSLVSWTNMPPVTTMAIVELNYSDARDEAEIDLLVTVPENEAPGYRSSTINFTASLGE